MNARPPTQTLGGDGEMKNWSHEGVAVNQFLNDYSINYNVWIYRFQTLNHRKSDHISPEACCFSVANIYLIHLEICVERLGLGVHFYKPFRQGRTNNPLQDYWFVCLTEPFFLD